MLQRGKQKSTLELQELYFFFSSLSQFCMFLDLDKPLLELLIANLYFIEPFEFGDFQSAIQKTLGISSFENPTLIYGVYFPS